MSVARNCVTDESSNGDDGPPFLPRPLDRSTWIHKIRGKHLSVGCVRPFEFCLPVTGTKVPARPERLYEIKYDRFRLLVERASA